MKRLTAAATLAVAALVAQPARAIKRPIPITRGIESQQYMGTGKGVIVGVLDGGLDATHPALRGQVKAQKDFTHEKTLDDGRGGDVGHGTGVAGLIIGHDAKTYTGIAPGAQVLNARVVRTDDYTTNLWAGNGLLWAARSGARVVNMSFGNKIKGGPLTDQFNLLADYVAEKYAVSIVSAAGNENDSAVQQAPAGSYNGYAVAALGPDLVRAADFSNYALPNDPRSKPDLIAPGVNVPIAAADWEKDTNYWVGTGSSFASPLVAGVLAQMTGYGKSKKMSTSPILLKAILTASATKVLGNGGDAWDPRSAAPDADFGHLATQPLDDEQGAGRVDALAAYRLYSKSKSKAAPYNVWRESKLLGNATYTLKLGTFSPGQHLDASLTWYRHVGFKDRNTKGADAKDTFYQIGDLADFTLTLLCDGVPVAGSDSDVDNLEYLSWDLKKKGSYTLSVYRFLEGGLKSEPFALAARVLPGTNSPAARALAASARGLPTDATGLLRGAQVPEPTGLAGIALLGLLLTRRHRRTRATC